MYTPASSPSAAAATTVVFLLLCQSVVAQDTDASFQDIKLENGVYIFNFPITFLSTASSNIRNEIETKFNDSYKILPGVRRVEIVKSSDRAGAAPTDEVWIIRVLFDAVYANSAVTDAATKKKLMDLAAATVANISSINVILPQEFEQAISTFVDSWRNPCAATGDICKFSYNCHSDTERCVHRCVGRTCSDRGRCIAADDVALATVETLCICYDNDRVYEYSGDDCEVVSMRWRYILLIIGCIAAIIIVALLITIAVLLLRKRRRVQVVSTERKIPSVTNGPVVVSNGYYNNNLADQGYRIYTYDGVQLSDHPTLVSKQDSIIRPAVLYTDMDDFNGTAYKNGIARPKVSKEPLSPYQEDDSN